MARQDVLPEAPVTFRIGEVAKLTGLTTRTLRYWEELGLIRPSAYRGRGERLYSHTDMARVTRIRDLQELLGFSLAEVQVVLDVEDVDVLDRVRSEYRRGGVSVARRRALLEEAIEANDKLLVRLDSTLARIGAFRDERAEKAVSLRATRDALVEEMEQDPSPARRPLSSGRTSRRAGTVKSKGNGRDKSRNGSQVKEGANQR
jgi:MerR family transcriptional regulator, repressor of the yfmOP operon